MKEKIKNFFLVFNRLSKRGLVLALLFFIILGSVLPLRSVQAAAWWDVLGNIGEAFVNAIVSIFLKFLGIFFLPGLLISALAVGIMSLILGWVISPDFISWKFTQNPFVDIGLSITQSFANMGFVLFLVAIGLATALRIEEYKAKKTLPVLIIIALLVNFSPVFCGIIIDATNIVMQFFLNSVTGLNGFSKFLITTGQTAWNLVVTSGLDMWANIAAFMQVLVLTAVNYFAAFIFVLFSTLFTMRYIMLWILVILSPIAFVSYILPITRRGRSLLSWSKWWEQLVAWSIIGIIAAFFLYLGFTMMSLIAAAPGGFISQPDLSWDGEGLGLMNNVLPYLIPLVLLWIAYRETKRTSAMFAKEIVEMPEKMAKSAAMVAITAATAGAASMAAGTLGKVGGKIAGTLGSTEKFGQFKDKHKVVGTLATPFAKPIQWATKGKGTGEGLKERFIEPAGEFVGRHKKLDTLVKTVKGGLTAAFLQHTKEEKEPLSDEEIEAGSLKIRDLTKKEDEEKWIRERRLTNEERREGVTKDGTKLTDKEIDDGWKGREASEEELKRGWIVGRKLTDKEMKQKYTIKVVMKPGVVLPTEEIIGKEVVEALREEGVEKKMEALGRVAKTKLEEAIREWAKVKKKRKLTAEEKERFREKGIAEEVLEEMEVEVSEEEERVKAREEREEIRPSPKRAKEKEERGEKGKKGGAGTYTSKT